MALAKKCDRCGKLYEHYPTGSKPQYNAIRRLYKTDDGGLMGSDNSIDLFSECMKAFDTFMINGKFVNE